MTVRFSSADESRLAIVRHDGFFSGDRVVIGEEAPRSPGLLVAEGRARAVWVYSSPRTPFKGVALGQSLAANLDLFEGGHWKLLEQLPTQRVDEIWLESTSERDLEGVTKQLSESLDLTDRLIFVPGAFRPRSLEIVIDGETFIIRDIRVGDNGGRPEPNSIVRISTETRITVAHRVTSGADIVILADCSGSMLVDDIPGIRMPTSSSDDDRPPWMPPGKVREQGITRMEALRRGLLRMLDARRNSPPNGSLTALVGFTRDWDETYPPVGMADISDETSASEIRAFQEAIWRLTPRHNACTKISKGLYLAASLLEQYGQPENRKLIVLASDGAETVVVTDDDDSDADDEDASEEKPPSTRLQRWRQLGEEDRNSAGKVTSASDDDPLMAIKQLYDQHDDLELRVYPISSEEGYQQWRAKHDRDSNDAELPNRELLDQLCNPQQEKPDDDQPAPRPLEDLLADLGNGVAEPVDALQYVDVQLSDYGDDFDSLAEAVDRLKATGPLTKWMRQRRELVGQIRRETAACEQIARETWNRQIFEAGAATSFLASVAEMDVCNRQDYHYFMLELAKGFFDTFSWSFLPAMLKRQHERGQFKNYKPLDVPEVETAYIEKYKLLWEMRNHIAHWKKRGTSPPVKAVRELMGVDALPSKPAAERWQEFQARILERLLVFVTEIHQALEESKAKAQRTQQRMVLFVG